MKTRAGYRRLTKDAIRKDFRLVARAAGFVDDTYRVKGRQAKRIAVFLLRYNVSLCFTSGFFSHAQIRLPFESSLKWVYANDSVIWEAFYYNRTLNTYVTHDDGDYNVTVWACDEMDRTTVRNFTIHKETRREAIELMDVLID